MSNLTDLLSFSCVCPVFDHKLDRFRGLTGLRALKLLEKRQRRICQRELLRGSHTKKNNIFFAKQLCRTVLTLG